MQFVFLLIFSVFKILLQIFQIFSSNILYIPKIAEIGPTIHNFLKDLLMLFPLFKYEMIQFTNNFFFLKNNNNQKFSIFYS